MIRWAEAAEVAEALNVADEFTLPSRVTCMRCGKMFAPTEDVAIRYNAYFGVFFFYCGEHETC